MYTHSTVLRYPLNIQYSIKLVNVALIVLLLHVILLYRYSLSVWLVIIVINFTSIYSSLYDSPESFPLLFKFKDVQNRF